jgi:hypothetical protein
VTVEVELPPTTVTEPPLDDDGGVGVVLTWRISTLPELVVVVGPLVLEAGAAAGAGLLATTLVVMS